MSQKNRIITVVLKVQEETEAKKIWEYHANNQLLAGCIVIGIANGDLIKENEELEAWDSSY